jgi:hypothetical protein
MGSKIIQHAKCSNPICYQGVDGWGKEGRMVEEILDGKVWEDTGRDVVDES